MKTNSGQMASTAMPVVAGRQSLDAQSTLSLLN